MRCTPPCPASLACPGHVQPAGEASLLAGCLKTASLPGARVSLAVIGSPAIFRHVGESGHTVVNGTDQATKADVVVVAAHDDFTYEELKQATQAAINGAEILAATFASPPSRIAAFLCSRAR